MHRCTLIRLAHTLPRPRPSLRPRRLLRLRRFSLLCLCASPCRFCLWAIFEPLCRAGSVQFLAAPDRQQRLARRARRHAAEIRHRLLCLPSLHPLLYAAAPALSLLPHNVSRLPFSPGRLLSLSRESAARGAGLRLRCLPVVLGRPAGRRPPRPGEVRSAILRSQSGTLASLPRSSPTLTVGVSVASLGSAAAARLPPADPALRGARLRHLHVGGRQARAAGVHDHAVRPSVPPGTRQPIPVPASAADLPPPQPCLVQWAQLKMECPSCRTPLPSMELL